MISENHRQCALMLLAKYLMMCVSRISAPRTLRQLCMHRIKRHQTMYRTEERALVIGMRIARMRLHSTHTCFEFLISLFNTDKHALSVDQEAA